MSQDITIQVQPRETLGKNESRRLRRSGLIPAVVYGGGRDPERVAVDPRPIGAVLETERGRNTLIHLRIGDRELKRLVMIREIQRHPVTDRLLHADFVRVEMDRKVEVSIPVVILGTPLGVKNEGGFVEFVHRQIAVRVLPTEIPQHVEVEIGELHVGQHLEAGQVPLPTGVELLTPPTETIVTVVGRQKIEEEAAATAAPAEGEAAAAEGDAAAAPGAAEAEAEGKPSGKPPAKGKRPEK